MFDRNRHREKKAEERRKTEEFLRLKKETEFEKGDMWALILAALTTIVPVAILTMVAIWFLTSLVLRLF
ncbi:MAG: hypothetical protein GX074_04155 [Erysipelothrix sp.]|nr:hypothetical protein [Erysipelothrix sp.]